MSMWYNLHEQKRIYERSTYSFLDWLGDVGGLFDGLILITRWIIQPFVSFSLSSKLLTLLFVETDENQPLKHLRKF